MNLRTIDLNLLVLLQALLEERHVSRAARRVGLSQPAMSNALDRCRQMFGDPLLERRGTAMRLTARAEVLRRSLTETLAQVDALVDQEPPGLDRIERTVTLVVADALAAVLIEPLLAATATAAPGITLAVRAWTSGAAALADVASGVVDIAVSVFRPGAPRGVLVEKMIDERYLLAGCAGHPALAEGAAQTWLDYPHVVVSADGATRTDVDDILAAMQTARRVGVAVPSFLLVPDLLRSSQMLALLPSLMLTGDRAAGLMTMTPPTAISGFPIEMAVHQRHHADVGWSSLRRQSAPSFKATRTGAEQVRARCNGLPPTASLGGAGSTGRSTEMSERPVCRRQWPV